MSGSILNLKQTNEPFHLKKIQVHVSERWPFCSAESPFVILNPLFQSETLDEITSMLDLLPDCHTTIAPAVQASDSGRQQLVIHDGGGCVSGGHVTQTEFLITKFARVSILNKRKGNKLIAMATREDFNPREIRSDRLLLQTI